MNKIMSDVKSCYICSDVNGFPAILLPDEEVVSIGRTRVTNIQDLQCSRKQVNLCASYADKCVTVEQTGLRSCGFNGAKTKRGEKYVAKHGDYLEIVYGRLPYKIEFKPAPNEKWKEPEVRRKRSRIDSDSENEDTRVLVTDKKFKNDFSTTAEAKTSKTEYEDINDQVDEETSRKILQKVKERSESPIAGGSKTHSMNSDSSKVHIKSWEEIDKQALMIYTAQGVQSRSKIAAYDMDNTVITTQSGYVFPKDHNDWKILLPSVPGKLKQLHADGYKIVIFTNQRGLGIGKSKPSDFKQKIEKVVQKLGVPIQVYIATAKDYYRKPITGMWDKLVNDKNDGVPVNKDESFFVGDAAGRPKDWAPQKKKDHSLADRLFAMNIGLKFQTPEEHFLNQRPGKFILPTFDPKELQEDSEVCDPSSAELSSKKQEVIIMVGGPGSGKSYAAKTYLKDYHHINRDKLGSWQKCVSAMKDALSKGKSVVIDNTNPDPASRQRFLDVAKTQNIPARCFVMSTPKDHARHNNRFRELTDPTHTTVSEVIINTYIDTHSTLVWRCTRFIRLLLLLCFQLIHAVTLYKYVAPYRKNYVAPKIDEGFSEIVKINFVPRFQTDEDRKLYQMYLNEK